MATLSRSRRAGNPRPLFVPLTIRQGAALLHLTRGKSALIDVADWPRAGVFKWCCDAHDYVVSRINDKKTYLHRFITGAGRGETVDHANRDRMDNRAANLRKCTQQQNSFNGPSRGGASRFKGVCWDSGRGAWIVTINSQWVGAVPDEETGAKVYDAAARHLHGPFALTNFPGTEAVSIEELRRGLRVSRNGIPKPRLVRRCVLVDGHWCAVAANSAIIRSRRLIPTICGKALPGDTPMMTRAADCPACVAAIQSRRGVMPVRGSAGS